MPLRPIRTRHLGRPRRTGGLQFLAAPASEPTVITDTFTRANSTSTPGSTETGQPWVVYSGVWGINSNQLYLATPSGDATTNDLVAVDCGASNYTATIKLTTLTATNAPSLAVCITDHNNCIFTTTTSVNTRVAGGNTNVATFSETFASGDTMRVTKAGSTVTYYRQAASAGAFNQVAQITAAQGVASTLVGVRSRTTNTARMDDFTLTTA